MRSPACVSAMHMNGSHGEEGERGGQLGYAPLGGGDSRAEKYVQSADREVRYDPNDGALYGLFSEFFFP